MSENKQPYHVEVSCYQLFHDGERICGDVFLSKRIPEENRILAILSDGMGSGVKANVLATLTASMAMNFSVEHKKATSIANILMKALPVCSVRKMSYATYTIVDINIENETVSILEYDNPQTIILRGSRVLDPIRENIVADMNVEDRRLLDLQTSNFKPQLEDRFIFCSDGITQSGLRTGLKAEWGRNQLREELRQQIKRSPNISASDLARIIVNKASTNDLHKAKDDLSCAVIYFRKPRKAIICTGPPVNPENDEVFAEKLHQFDGKKIVSGATTADIIARKYNKTIEDEEIVDKTLPPSSKMRGVDLITEGILTLSKALYLLVEVITPSYTFTEGPADKMCKLLLESDEIYILVGTKINENNFDFTQPYQTEIRKNIIQRLVTVLSEKYLKVVEIEYM